VAEWPWDELLDPGWRRDVTDRLVRQVKHAARYTRVVLVAVAAVMLVVVLVAARAQVMTETFAASAFSDDAVARAYLSVLKPFIWTQLAAWAASLVVFAVFAFAMLAGMGVVEFCTDIVYALVTTDDEELARKSRRFDRLLRSGRLKALFWAGALYIALGVIGFALLRIETASPERVVIILTTYFAGMVPYGFAVWWYQALRIRRQTRSQFLDIYLFSKQTARHYFKATVDMMLYLGMLAWFFFAPVVTSFSWIGSSAGEYLRDFHSYDSRWETLAAEGATSLDWNSSRLFDLPAPDDLGDRLFILGDVGGFERWRETFPVVLDRMFLMLTITGLLAVGSPALVGTAIYKDGRGTIRSVLSATIKSTLLVLGLQLFIRKVYLVDPSRITGSSILFFLAVSYFLMQESMVSDKPQAVMETKSEG
jgi:hypothetical protein